MSDVTTDGDTTPQQVLVLNSGSSSIKYRLFDAHDTELASGLVERIGERTGRTTHVVWIGGEPEQQVTDERIPDHDTGFASIVETLTDAGLDAIGAVGHRVVHGGAAFSEPARIDADVVDRIRAQIPLAPLHNPANLVGIEVATRLLPQVPQVAVFDTAFHSTMPAAAARYAIPGELYERYGIRRYGFHGTSHGYVARRAAAYLERPIDELKLVTLHLGNGASATAIDGGRSVDTSMGLSPLEGLVMGTRSGDIDPAIVFHLLREADMEPDEVERLLNRGSGLLGLCGDNDLRTVQARADDGDADARLALDVYCHRIRRYVGAFAAVLGGLDALVFTAGVGEHSDVVRARVCAGLGVLGIELDPAANKGLRLGDAPADVVAIHRSDARTAVLVVATDEEREIAIQTRACLHRRVGTDDGLPAHG